MIQENSYDAEGMWYSIRENGRQTSFQTDEWSILEEESEEGNQKSLVWGNSLLASEEAGNYHYYHKNEHGDIELLTEETGRITNRYQYEAFGGLIQAEEEEKNRFRYSGEIEDELTGQYYLRARYYCPRLGRFTQEDSYRGDGLNLYAYCRNNPVFYIDPSGYQSQCPPEENEVRIQVGDDVYEMTRYHDLIDAGISYQVEASRIKELNKVDKNTETDETKIRNADKTVAYNGNHYSLSGFTSKLLDSYNYGGKRDDFIRTPVSKIQAIRNLIRNSAFSLKNWSSKRDRLNSHAEKQLLIGEKDYRVIGVSKEMCLDCQIFFQFVVVDNHQDMGYNGMGCRVVVDPEKIRIFETDGRVYEVNTNTKKLLVL